MISCILLAAGLSQRFLSPKALAQLDGKTIIERIQEMLIQTTLDEIVIVLGYDHNRIKPHLLNHKKIKFVYNKNFNLGQTSSFQIGLSAVSHKSKGIFLLPIDFPLIKKSTFDFLITYSEQMKYKKILIPTFQHKKGHPPYFPSFLFHEFHQLGFGEGINVVSHRYKNQVDLVEVDDSGVIESFNTQEEFETLKSKFNSSK